MTGKLFAIKEILLVGHSWITQKRTLSKQASKLHWNEHDDKQSYIKSLFKMILVARADERIKEDDPQYVQYKGWDKTERIFVLRRKDRKGRELVALFNLDGALAEFIIDSQGVQARNFSQCYIIALDDAHQEEEWSGIGTYSPWLDTDARQFGGCGSVDGIAFEIAGADIKNINVAPESVTVLSKLPPDNA